MKHFYFVAPTLVVAIALAGCSVSSNDISESAPQATETKASGVPRASPSVMPSQDPTGTGQQWVDAVMQQWLDFEGARSIQGFIWPFNLVTRWESTEPGEIVLHVADSITRNAEGISDYSATSELDSIAGVMMQSVAEEFPTVENITAVTEDGTLSVDYARGKWERSQPVSMRDSMMAADPRPESQLKGQAWADEKMNQWFEQLGVQGPEGLVSSFRLITSWESSEKGELVIHLDKSFPSSYDVGSGMMTVEEDLQGISVTILDNLYMDAPELEQVTAVVDGSGQAKSVDRDDSWFTAS